MPQHSYTAQEAALPPPVMGGVLVCCPNIVICEVFCLVIIFLFVCMYDVTGTFSYSRF